MFTYIQQPTQRAPHPSENIDLVHAGDEQRGAIYISGLEGAKNLGLMLSKSISSVLTVGSDIADIRFPPSVNHKIIHILDFPDQDIKIHFKGAIEFIEEQLLQKRNILIHCYVGISRSVTITIAYLMQIMNLSLNEGFKKVKDVRPLIRPNEGFLFQLYQFYQNLKVEKEKIISQVIKREKLALRQTQYVQSLSNHKICILSERRKNKQLTSFIDQSVPIQVIASRAFTERTLRPLVTVKLSVRS